MKAIAGLDLGTQSSKACVVGVDGVEIASAAVPVEVVRRRPGWAEQDPQALLDSAIGALASAIKSAPPRTRVHALGIAGQMGGAIGVGPDLEPLTRYESWMDSRVSSDRERIEAGVIDEVTRANGIVPFVGPRVSRWLRERPELKDMLRSVVTPTGYVSARLTGSTTATCDYTQANLYGAYDAAHRRWDERLASMSGIPTSLLPTLVSPAEVVGTLTCDAATALGVPTGIPVVGGLGDGTAGWLAGGAVSPGACVETGGTSGNFAITVDAFGVDPAGVLTCMPSALEGQWYLIGFTMGTGLTHRWLAGLLADGDYAALEHEASTVEPGSEGVLCLPHLYGRASPSQPEARGMFVGFDESTSRGHLYRSFLEALTYELSWWASTAAALHPGLELAEVTAIGGGSKSALWTQIKADVLGVPVKVLKPPFNAARGAALAAAVGTSLVERFDEPTWMPSSGAVEREAVPNPEAHAAYRSWSQVYPQVVELVRPALRVLNKHNGGVGAAVDR